MPIFAPSRLEVDLVSINDPKPTERQDSTVALGSAKCCGPVEAAVGVLHQPSVGVGAVRGVEAVQRGQRAIWRDFEDGAIPFGPSIQGCPVEVPIVGLNQRRPRLITSPIFWG